MHVPRHQAMLLAAELVGAVCGDRAHGGGFAERHISRFSPYMAAEEAYTTGIASRAFARLAASNTVMLR